MNHDGLGGGGDGVDLSGSTTYCVFPNQVCRQTIIKNIYLLFETIKVLSGDGGGSPRVWSSVTRVIIAPRIC